MPVDPSDLLPGLARWLTLPVEGMAFPARCCRCGEKTEAWKVFESTARATVKSVIGQLGGVVSKLSVKVPFCERCGGAQRRRRRVGVLVGLGVGVAFGMAAVAILPFSGLSSAAAFMARAAILVSIAVGGASIGASQLAGHEPVKLRDYDERRGTVQIWFENPDYRASVEDLMGDGPTLLTKNAGSEH